MRAVVGFVAVSAGLAACAGNNPNVRALHLYEREPPSPERLQAHVAQLGQTLEVVHQLLRQTPYSPGASWVSTLPLDEVSAERARALVPAHKGEMLFVEVYAAHVRSVMAAARAATPPPLTPPGAPAPAPGESSVLQAPAAAPASGAYPSLLDALSQVHPDLARDARAVDPRLLRDPANARIVRDAVTVSSVALRLVLEAMSLASVAGLEIAALTGSSPEGWLRRAPSAVALARSIESESGRIQRALETDAATLKQLLATLAKVEGIDPEDAPGYAFREGLVDEIVGFSWDSVHLEVQGGGEALFYSAIADPEQSAAGDGTTYDYTGRQARLRYDVEPIVLAAARASLKFDWAKWAEVAGLDLGYATNRVYRSGGDLGSGSLANELGVEGSASDALDAAMSIAGVKASVRLARFTHGKVEDVFVADGSVLAEAPLTFDMKQIDIGYDLAPRRGPLLETLTVGFRYFDYTLPRILYELQNVTPGAEDASYVFSRETPAQSVRTRYYMGSIAALFEQRLTPEFTPYGLFDLAVGFGPTAYYFLFDPNGDDIPSNRDNAESTGVGVAISGALGCRYRFVGQATRLNAYFDVQYRGQFIGSTLDSKNDGDTIVNVGTTDVFHGPVASLGAEF